MKKLLLLFSLYSLNLCAQSFIYHPFPTANALWTEETYMGTYTRLQYGFIGDTVIGANTWHKLYQRNTPCYDSSLTTANSTLIGGLREDGAKRIYFYAINWMFSAPGTIRKVYDFSKTSVGDTLQFSGPGTPYPVLTIASVDSVDVGGTYRKKWTFAEGEKWVEGIGSMRALLSLITPIPTCSCYQDFLCHKQSGALVYMNPVFNYCYCPLGVGIHEAYPGSGNIYPNPTSSDINFTQPLKDATVTLFNSKGEKVQEYFKQSGTTWYYNRAALKPGIYFLEVVEPFKPVYREKIVITDK